MSDEQHPLNPSSNDHIEAHIGDGASDVIVGKDITSVRAGERGVAIAGDAKGTTIVTGDGNIVDNRTVISQRLDPKDAKNQRNHAVMRQLVRKFWIDGVLKSSLYNEVLIRLNLTEQPKAVENRPWDLILQQPGKPNYEIPPGTPIINVFDQMGGLLLILGEPGSGKTTMLLELADELLKRAESDPTYPTPVVFNLSSWAEKRLSLAEWLVEELRTKYNIPKKVAQRWMADDELLPLLDGLDEVRQENREDCVKAINQFRQDHLVPIAVCSRSVEYSDLSTRILLQGAVLVQPLTIEQMGSYLTDISPQLSTIHTVLAKDIELQRLAQSPLMLGILSFVYSDTTLSQFYLTDRTQNRRYYLFNTYIQRMFLRRGTTANYSFIKAIYWLQWLATRLLQSGQSIFLIERMQPNWMQPSGHKIGLTPIIMVLAGPIYGLIYGLIVGLFVGLFVGLGVEMFGGPLELSFLGPEPYPLEAGLFSGLNNGLSTGLIVGLIVGLIDGFSGNFREIDPIEHPTVLKRNLTSSLWATLFWGLLTGLFFLLVSGRSAALLVGFVFGLSGGLLAAFRQIEPTKNLGWSWHRMKDNLYFGLLVTLIFWLLNRLLNELGIGLIFGIDLGFWGKLFREIKYLLPCGLIGGLISGVLFETSAKRTDILFLRDTQTSNRSIKLSIRYSLTASLIYGLFVAQISWLGMGVVAWGLNWGVLFGILGGLSCGGHFIAKHYVLRVVLWWKNFTPWNYNRFLDYCYERIFLRKVGDGYIFIHRMLLEHFASLTDEDINRLVAEVEASRS